jgi:hypothetical protein
LFSRILDGRCQVLAAFGKLPFDCGLGTVRRPNHDAARGSGRFCHQFVPFFASFCSQLAHRLIVYDEDRFAAARLNARIGVLYLGKSQQSSDSSADSATSPCIRVRTRRFERLR